VKSTGDSHIYDLVRSANPINADSLPDPSGSASAQALCQRILHGQADSQGLVPAPVAPRRPYRRMRFSLVSLLALVALGAGVSYAMTSGGGGVADHTVACYASSRLDADRSVFAAVGSDPIATCQQAQAAGRVRGLPPMAGQPMRACVLPTHTVGVFPASSAAMDPCGALHLTPLSQSPTSPSTTPSAVDPVATMSASVIQTLSAGCLDQGSALAAVHAAFDQAGLTGWTVEAVAPFSGDRPCASPGIDDVNHIVLLIPIPKA
jgi:hypothetical protein